MRFKAGAAAVAAVVLSASNLWGGSVGSTVEVRIVADDGRTLPTYPVRTRSGVSKVYAEAVKGEHYRIEVTNRLNRRVGVVIAVDGRNIISGQKSWLKNTERMYILDPYGSGNFDGWRTGNDRVNRFYFTDVPNSYAAAFGDESAMGVIAVAAYPEVVHQPPPRYFPQATPSQPYGGTGKEEKAAGPAPAAKAGAGARAQAESAMDSAGTGFGREEYSPVQIVEFEPEARAVSKVLIKYEWRSTLCRMGVAQCSQPVPVRPANRIWDNDGFAPYPPCRS